MHAKFVVIRHNGVMAGIHELAGTETTVGRGESCGIRLPNSFVSREHALLFTTEQECRIRDLNSQNGTYVGGHKITGEETLRDGTEVRIAPYSLTICFDEASVIRLSARFEESTYPRGDAEGELRLTDSLAKLLTPTQFRVCELLAQGYIEKEVAGQMKISIHTVHDHVKAIYKALSVSTRGELVSRWASQSRQQSPQ